MRAGVIGLGDMGSGLAKNLIHHGFETWGFDVSQKRLDDFKALGGHAVTCPAELGAKVDAVYVMVMNGEQVKDVLFGPDGLVERLKPKSAIIMTATIKPKEMREIGGRLEDRDLYLIDSPVSGGFPGAQGGTLTMMAAAPHAVLDQFAPVMQAVSANIHRVGDKPGDGQTVKACLQSLIGAQFSATFEAAALAAKAGVSGQVILDVFSTSSAGCGVVNNALQKIIDRQFVGTGSHINTMHKDLTISMNLGEELGVPLHTAAAAMQVFHAGKTKHPEGDNWVCTRVIEDIIGAELHRSAAKKTRGA
ncbi:3-hydroxyisobutyrate dehydrogenase [Roseibium sp. TrichSKD4]|uniref:NAD(P)-dependent oxidoreductase n=1 Tax=Roseibium sp. TrichSKD4 TaxID=744980 RepID=UPI0001E56F26|nr:NAD(P)-dependent oxidoreductase [Roseibium sp. TrichSKD4]EFO32083.1 3-hydroxyisobutyrate dehydrogenase [Roseibium sp. TrichSKD4]